MTRYIIEKDSQEATWNVREDGTETKLGSLTRKGVLFTVESEEFFAELDGKLQLLTPERIFAMVGGMKKS